MKSPCMQCGKRIRKWTIKYIGHEKIMIFCERCWLKLLKEIENGRMEKPEWLDEYQLMKNKESRNGQMSVLP